MHIETSLREKLKMSLLNYQIGDEEQRSKLLESKHKMRKDSLYVGMDFKTGLLSVPDGLNKRWLAELQIMHSVHYTDDLHHAYLEHAWAPNVRRKYFKYLDKRGEGDGKIKFLGGEFLNT